MTDVAVSATPAGLSPAPVDALRQQLRTLDFPPPYQRGDKAAARRRPGRRRQRLALPPHPVRRCPRWALARLPTADHAPAARVSNRVPRLR